MAVKGEITLNEFLSAATWMVTTSEKLGDNWVLCNIPVSKESSDIYLSRKTFKNIHISSSDGDADHILDVSFPEKEDTVSDELDSGCLSYSDEFGNGNKDHSSCLCQIEHHIIYSHSYRVPVMYFNIYKPGGKLLSLDEIWSCAVRECVLKDTSNLWSFITQQEHPFLRRPYFYLHPCHTSDLMCQVRKNVRSSSEYLLSWLSVVCPAVQLDLSLRYAVELENDISSQTSCSYKPETLATSDKLIAASKEH